MIYSNWDKQNYIAELKLSKRIFLCLFTLVLVFKASAEKMSAALIKNPSASNELITTIDVECQKPKGNATYTSGNKKNEACWTRDGDQVKIELLDGSGIKTFPATEFYLIAEIPATSSNSPAQSNKGLNNHLSCSADGMNTQVDIERDEIGKLKRVIVEGDDVFAIEKYTKIEFTFDGYDFIINSVNGTFTYESSGVSSYLIKLLAKTKSKGSGECKISELIKKF